jgi:phosphoserine phosphatase RsbU/P
MTVLAPHRVRCGTIWGGISSVNLDVATKSLSASIYSSASEGESGGDIYYFSVCGYDMLTRIAVADLQGHGEGVSTLSGWLYDCLEERLNSHDGAGVLEDLNQLVYRPSFDAITTAAVIGFCVGDPNLHLSYAGHPPVYLHRHAEAAWRPLVVGGGDEATNLPLGILPHMRYLQTEIPLEPKDRIFLYTDGVLECPDASGEPFGTERLLEALKRHESQGLSEAKAGVLESLRAHSGGTLEHDDVTLVFLEVN